MKKKLFLDQPLDIKIKETTKLRLTIFTPDGPNENEYIGVDFKTGEIIYASSNFKDSEPDFENCFSYIV